MDRLPPVNETVYLNSNHGLFVSMQILYRFRFEQLYLNCENPQKYLILDLRLLFDELVPFQSNNFEFL